MKQEAFIQRLRQGLASLPKHDVEEIVADYREYIGDAVAAGRDEEEVIAALGDPDKLAREFRAQATYRQWQARRSFGNLARVVVSIAGLGLLNLLLLVPFMIYLALLTAAYMISGAFALGGLILVVYLGSHQVFGWPAADKPSIHIGTSAKQSASDASKSSGGDSEDVRDATPDLGNVKVENGNFVLTLDDGSKASIVTRNGPVMLKNEDGDMKIVAVGNGADKLITAAGDDRYRIATRDVSSIEVKDDEGKKVTVTHAGDDPSTLVWDVRDDDGSDHVQFRQDAHGDMSRLAVKSGTDSVVIDPSQGITVKSDDSHVKIVAPMGWSLGAATWRCALAMLIGGTLGLFVCIWLTRKTWLALSCYVHRQAAALAARLDERGQTS